MDNLPAVNVNAHPITSWANKVNQNVSQNKVVTSSDFIIRKTGRGTFVELKRKNKPGYDFLRYRGDYDPSKGFSIYDVVRVLPDEEYTDSAGDVIEATPGVWVCVVNIPSREWSDAFTGDRVKFKRYVRQADVDYFPVWPEPDEKATLENPDGRYWELISLLPVQMVACENGIEKTHYVDAFQPDTDEDE